MHIFVIYNLKTTLTDIMPDPITDKFYQYFPFK